MEENGASTCNDAGLCFSDRGGSGIGLSSCLTRTVMMMWMDDVFEASLKAHLKGAIARPNRTMFSELHCNVSIWGLQYSHAK